MKYTACILGILLLSALCLQGQHGNGNGRNSSGRGGAGMAMRSQSSAPVSSDSLTPLKQFANLSDKQLVAIRNVIDQILAMSPEEREAFRQKIAEYEELDPETQQFIRQGWGRVSATARDDWREMMLSLDRVERDRIREKLGTLSFEEKIEYRLQLIGDWKRRQSESIIEE